MSFKSITNTEKVSRMRCQPCTSWHPTQLESHSMRPAQAWIGPAGQWGFPGGPAGHWGFPVGRRDIGGFPVGRRPLKQIFK